MVPHRVRRASLAGHLALRFATREPVPPARQFLDGAALLQLGKHLKERSIFGLLQMQTLRDIARGSGLASNLQKAQYVIEAKM